MLLQHHSLSVSSRLDQQMRRSLILHETALVKGFSLPTLSTLILFICFSIDLVCVSNYDQNYVCNHRLYVCIIPKNSSTCIAEKSHHCHRSKK